MNIPKPELLAGLAEEASELAQAALKYRRTFSNDNPTTMTGQEAYSNLLEEIADVELYIKVLGFGYDNEKISEKIVRIQERKLQRWKERLGET